jgi:TetR/AcrR family transcriptional regulator, transcriptional repressor of bet genes
MIRPSVQPRLRYTRLKAQDRRRVLIEAALTCIAEGGIQAFTVDRICARAQVSRGLITHHFGSMEALLAALYDQLYSDFLPPPADRDILALLDHLFSPAQFNRDRLNIWLTMWSEISNRPALRAVHRSRYRDYLAQVAEAIQRSSSRPVQAEALAARLICLIDGLDLQYCIDPESLTAAQARQACLDLLLPHTGPLA